MLPEERQLHRRLGVVCVGLSFIKGLSLSGGGSFVRVPRRGVEPSHVANAAYTTGTVPTLAWNCRDPHTAFPGSKNPRKPQQSPLTSPIIARIAGNPIFATPESLAITEPKNNAIASRCPQICTAFGFSVF